MAALTGQKLADNACVDSFNVLGALLGNKDATGRDHLVQQPNRANSLALRVGEWKILEFGRKKSEKQAASKSRTSLYHLTKDPAEKRNVAAEHPNKLKELQDKLSSGSGRAAQLTNEKKQTDEEKIRGLYRIAFSREPLSDELNVAIDYISQKKDRKHAYEDILWALMNTKEFLFNH